MHRTQVLLEEKQYIDLRQAARSLGKSMGELIRDFVTLGLADRLAAKGKRRYRLADLDGIINAPGLKGAEHDRILYGEER